MKRFSGALLLLGLAFVANSAAAQTSVERFNRQLEQIQRETTLQADTNVPVDQRTLVDYGGYFTGSYLTVEDFNRDTHVLREADLVGYARVNIDGAHEFFVRGIARYRDFNDQDSFDGEGDQAHFFLDRAYYRFDLQRSVEAYEGRRIDQDVTLQAGRQLVYWGSGLTLSQVLDGAVVELRTGTLSLQFLGGITAIHDTVDFDSSRPHFDDHTRRGFYGAQLSWQLSPSHRPYAYVLFQQDYNHSEVRTTGIFQTHFDYDTWYAGVGSTGSLTDQLLYTAEFVYEGGRGLTNSFSATGGGIAPIPQVYDDVSAWAGDARLDYVFADPRHPRLSAEFIIASGDDDRLHTSNTFGGNKPGTKDRAFNAFGLLNTGLAFAPSVSNLMALRTGGSIFPVPDSAQFKRLQIGADFFVFGKVDRNAPIDEGTLEGRFLGVEPDIFINWQISSDVTLALRYGVFFPNSDVVVSGDTRQFFYAGLTFAF
jgi:hypothetical protein